MDPLKDAFTKVREDMNVLFYEIEQFKSVVAELQWKDPLVSQEIKSLKKEQEEIKNLLLTQLQTLAKNTQFLSQELITLKQEVSTQQAQIRTDTINSSTEDTNIRSLNDQIKPISIGNEGVPTDRQTDQQTDQQTQSLEQTNKNQGVNSIQHAADMLDSLDSLKKEIRLKFKRLTEQEMLVFSTLYQVEEEQGHADYKEIALKLNLSQSSIRDYIGRLIAKGVPIEKHKVNNKSIQLTIAQSLRKVTSLSTILTLRDL